MVVSERWLGRPDLIRLDSDQARDPSVVGSKAANLAHLRALGEPVPNGVVVPPEMDPEQAAVAIVDSLGDVSVAVRSSSPAEDLDLASYAGQYETRLGVRGVEDVDAAIRSVRESATAAPDRGYGAPYASEMAVLVMPMIEADAAGVAFTANPVTGDREIIVEAVAGLGDRLVSGEATPQRWVVDVDGPGMRGPASEVDWMSGDDVLAVADLARRVKAAMGVEQDIEWAIERGVVHLLQSRPITALPIEPSVELPNPSEIWTRADENFAGPVRPLEFSVWAPIFERTAESVFGEIGAPIVSMTYREIGGWMYLRAVPPMDKGRDDMPTPSPLVFGLAVRLIPAFRSRLRRAARVWASDLGDEAITAWESGGRDQMRRRVRDLLRVERASLADTELVSHLDDVLSHLQSASDAHFRLPTLATFMPMGHLGVLCERTLGWAADQTVVLVQGWSTVTEAAEAIDLLAASIAADPEATRLVAENPRGLVGHPGPGGDALRDYLDEHGHQIVGMDLSHPTWAEDPTPLLSLVRARLDPGGTERAPARDSAVALEREALTRLGQKDAEEFERALARARRGVSYGDETEIDVLEALGVVRHIALEIGDRLAQRGILPEVGSVFFLTVEECRAALTGETGIGLASDTRRRRAEHRWAEAHPGPPAYGPPTPPWPDTRYVPRKVRPFLDAMIWVMSQIEGAAVEPDPENDQAMRGIAASPGRATGPVRVIRDPSQFDRIQPGEVLVCPATMAAWSVVFPIISAIITERGGPLSHPGILAREFGIPAVLAIPGATSVFHDGQVVTVDGTRGIVEA